MNDHYSDKKYSKISPALKCCFLECLYLQGMTIKDAATRCKLNYSTAKVIIRDLNQRERKYVKRVMKMRENQFKNGELQKFKVCQYKNIVQVQEGGKDLSESANTILTPVPPTIQIISRVAFDFFAKEEKGQ